jgi:putative DNA primase/helicase
LPELLAADVDAYVFIVEGEKDVDRLTKAGLVATCNAGGAGKWTADHAAHFTGRNVVAIPDNDTAGRKHADQVARSLAGKAATIKVISQLSNVPEKGDVSDYLDAGGTTAGLLYAADIAAEWAPTENILTAPTTDTKVPKTARHTTDVGNAERFTEQHGADVRFCHAWGKWFVWNGRCWALDCSGEVMRRAKQTSRSIYSEASKAGDKEQREALAKWAAASERRERLTAMIALAESDQPIPIPVETLDSEPYLLNCENGTLDLRTGELRDHRREDCLTKLCALEYPTDAGCDPELWLLFLDRIFAGNAQLIGFVQRLLGMALVGEVIEHILPIFYGVGANGKSVLLETFCGMLGPDYAMNAPTALLMATKSDRHPTELADLHGKRFVAAVETADGGRLSESLVKELTGGDSIRARRMRENFWQFRPSHTVVLATNHKPTIRGTDHGIWRRIRLVPFVVTIPDTEQDKQLTQKLRGEWPMILRWAVAGCLDWQRNGLQAPDEVLQATEEYRADMDVLGEFIHERCEVEAGSETRASDLYRDYKGWSEKRGEYVESQKRFGTRLGERGFIRRPTRNGILYRGIGLLPVGCEACE